MKTADLMTSLGYQPLPYSYLWQSFSRGMKTIHIDGITANSFSAALSMCRNDNDEVTGRIMVSIMIQGLTDVISYEIGDNPQSIIQTLPTTISSSCYLQDVELIVNAVWNAYQKTINNDFTHSSIFDQPCADQEIGYAAIAFNTPEAGINEYKTAFEHLNKVFPRYKSDYIFMSFYNGCCGKLRNCGVDYHTLL